MSNDKSATKIAGKDEQIATLKKELASLKKRKKFGLVWESKPEDVVEQCKKEFPVLEEVKNLAISTDDSKPTNLLIEGDNYHALSVLNYTHKGKIDVIYIDPPYNTGTNDWKYNNDFVDKNDGYRHSKWLSMMANRLTLAKNLLKNNGVIIVTIDDYELYTLGLLMDSIFSEQNRIGVLAVESNPRGRTMNKFFATSHEYYLIYAKNYEQANIENLPLTEEQENLFHLEDNISKYRLLPFRRSGGLSTPEERPNSFYPIYYDKKKEKISIEKMDNAVEIFPVDTTGRNRVWRQTKPSLMNAVNRGDILIKQNKDKYTIYMKDRIKDGRKPKTVWVNPKYDASSSGTILVNKILGSRNSFNYPKSLYAVLDSLSVFTASKKNAIILDFFAGSGTTGHAVSMLNKHDNGNRRFILCTNNENGIAREVCQPRIKAVIKGQADYPDITGILSNLKYFKTTFVPSQPTDQNKKKLTQKVADMLCVRENTFEQVKSVDAYKIYRNKHHYTGIIYNEDEIENFKKVADKLKGPFNVYVFSLGNEDFEEEFADMKNKVKLQSIPDAVMRAYRRIFK